MAAYEPKTGIGSDVGSRSGMTSSGVTSSDQAIEAVQERARATAQQVQRAGQDAAEGVRQVAGNFSHAFEQSLRERPAATVGMVAALGFVLGALWKR